jgi:hypothetical protein
VDGRLKVAKPARQIIADETVFRKQMVQAVCSVRTEGDANRAKYGADSNPTSRDGGH